MKRARAWPWFDWEVNKGVGTHCADARAGYEFALENLPYLQDNRLPRAIGAWPIADDMAPFPRFSFSIFIASST
jgi:hypothetical protein